jgi:hypothetical protein
MDFPFSCHDFCMKHERQPWDIIGEIHGHGDRGRVPLNPVLPCLDYGAGKRGKLTACRGDGEPRLDSQHFLTATDPAPQP